jgi:predicted phosphodiesterase
VANREAIAAGWRRARLPVVAALVVLAGVLLGMRMAGSTTVSTELGRVSYELSPSLGGRVEAYVPIADWGFRAPAFSGPIELRLELRTVDREAALDAAGGRTEILAAARDDLRSGASDAIVETLLWCAVSTLLIAVLVAIVWSAAGERRRAFALLVAGSFAILVGGSLLLARATFDEAELEQPTFYASGAELERLLAAAENARIRTDYGSELESVLRGLSTVLVDRPIARRFERTVFAGSDLHGNALVIDPLARYFDGAPLFLVGDFGQRGTAAETRLIAPRVAALGEEVVAVSGNHDSALIMERLAAEGVEVLGGEVRGSATTARAPLDVAGLSVAGYPDPFLGRRSDPDADVRPITFEELPDGEEAFEREAKRFRGWFDSLSAPPDVVLVHQAALGQALAASLHADGYSSPLTIVAGHDHEQHIDLYGSITLVDPGTIGAGGVFEAGERFAGIAGLHFEADRPILGSVDLIAVEPFSGRARGSRVVIDSLCPDSGRCTYEPGDPEVTAVR